MIAELRHDLVSQTPNIVIPAEAGIQRLLSGVDRE
jgi:hypothetical protein